MSVREMRALIQHLGRLIEARDISALVTCLAKEADYTAGESQATLANAAPQASKTERADDNIVLLPVTPKRG